VAAGWTPLDPYHCGVFPLLLLLFIVVPVVELAVIIRVGVALGVWETIVLILLIGLFGAALWKQEGRRTWVAFRDALEDGRWPGDEITQGALVLFGGALLITPGFITDVVGLLAVLPPSRALASRIIRRQLTPVPLRNVFWARDRYRAHRARSGDVYDVDVVSVERDEEQRDDADRRELEDGRDTEGETDRGPGDGHG
jgi:UPF0716 protein FxsA